MANKAYGHHVYGMRDIKVTNIGGTLQEDLDTAQELRFTPEFRVGEQIGDDALKAVISFIIGGNGRIGAGSVSSAALAIMTGKSLSVTGSSPNEVTTLKWSAGDNMPYFKVYGKALDEASGDLHLLMSKVKIVGGGELSLRDAQWYTGGFDIRVLDDGTNGCVRQVQNETAANLPTS